MAFNEATRKWIRSAVSSFARGELPDVIGKVLKPKDPEASVVTDGQETTDKDEPCTPTRE